MQNSPTYRSTKYYFFCSHKNNHVYKTATAELPAQRGKILTGIIRYKIGKRGPSVVVQELIMRLIYT